MCERFLQAVLDNKHMNAGGGSNSNVSGVARITSLVYNQPHSHKSHVYFGLQAPEHIPAHAGLGRCL